jgi:hypothetical protein
MLYPKTQGMIFFSERYCRHLKEIMSFNVLKVKALSPILHFFYGMEWAGLKDE